VSFKTKESSQEIFIENVAFDESLQKMNEQALWK
jgi:hypothetical protein